MLRRHGMSIERPTPPLASLALVTASLVSLALGGCAASFVIDMKDANLGELRREAARVRALALRYRGAPGALLLARDVLEHFSARGSQAWSFQHIRVRRVLVLDPRHDLVRRFRLDVPQHYELTDVQIVVVPPGAAKVQRFGRSDLRRVKRPGGVQRYELSYSGLVSGSIVEARTRVELGLGVLAPPLYQRVALRHALPAARVELAFVCPRFWRLSARRLGARGKRVRYELGDYPPYQRAVRYSARDVPALPDEPLAAPLRAAADHFEIQLIATPDSAEQYSGPTNWAGIADSMRGALGLLEASAIPPELRRVVEGAPALRRVEALVRWVQAHIKRDDGAGSTTLSATLKARRGTPLRIVALTAALVRALTKVDASTSLVRSTALGRFDRRFISPEAFDTPVLLYRSPVGYRLALPYVPWLPPRVVPGTLGQRPVLLIDGSKAGKLLATPRAGLLDVRVSSRARLDPAAGRLEMSERWSFRGVAAALLRGATSAAAGPQRARLRRVVALGAPEAQLRASASKAPAGAAELRGRYQLTRGVSAGDDAVVIKSPRFLAFGAHRVAALASFAPGGSKALKHTLGEIAAALRSPRARRLRSPQRMHLQRRLTLELPEGFKAVRWPRFREVHNDFGRARASTVIEGNRVTIEQDLELAAFDEKSRRAKELAKLLAVVTDASESLVLHKPSAPRNRPARRRKRRR